MNTSSPTPATRARQNRARLAAVALVTAVLLAGHNLAAAQDADETMPDGAWGGFAAAQVYAQRTLYGAMQSAAAWLKDYCQQHGRCPESSDDIASIESDLQQLMPVNPYFPSSGAKTPIRVQFDETLSDLSLSHYRQRPPDSWSAPAGTITVVVSNTHDLFVIWGAGMDKRPVRHELSHKVLLVVRHCGKPS
ncbi:MAG TPA: hypothetical protein V6D08_09520 [Candidatus Obscuribacterales bacterium]